MPLPSLRLIPIPTALLASALMLTACSSSDPGTTTTTAATPAPIAPAPGQPRPAGVDFQKINDCLQAAGIDVPSGMPTDRPSGMPTDFPSNRPSGMGAPGQGGAPGGAFNDPEAQAALKACGIELTTPPTR
jgi:hypothetical protein